MYQPATPKHEKRFAIAGMTTVTTAATLTALHVGAGGVGSLITAGIIVIPVVAMFGAIFLVKGASKKTND